MKYIVGSVVLMMAFATNAAKDWPEVAWGGYLMLDHAAFSDLFLEHDQGSQHSSDVRRARLAVAAEWHKDWESKIQVDISDGDSLDIKDAWLKYKGWKWANLTLGQQKEPFGLEKLSGSRNLFMMERSMVSEALAPGRSIGVQLNGKLDKFNWQLGYFQEDNGENSNAVTGRVSWARKNKDNDFFHLGAAFSERDLKGDGFRINEPLEVYGSDSLFEGKRLQADSSSLKGIELMWQYHGLASMAEWQQADVDDISTKTYRYKGGYYQISYLLSGKNRRYKKGKLKRFAADNDWELSLRLSQFELEREDRKATTLTAGVNYWLNQDLAFKLNYIRAKHEDEEKSHGTDDAIALRLQYSF